MSDPISEKTREIRAIIADVRALLSNADEDARWITISISNISSRFNEVEGEKISGRKYMAEEFEIPARMILARVQGMNAFKIRKLIGECPYLDLMVDFDPYISLLAAEWKFGWNYQQSRQSGSQQIQKCSHKMIRAAIRKSDAFDRSFKTLSSSVNDLEESFERLCREISDPAGLAERRDRKVPPYVYYGYTHSLVSIKITYRFVAEDILLEDISVA